VMDHGVHSAQVPQLLITPSKMKTCYAAKLDFQCTNNIEEYEAVLQGLKLKAMGIRRTILKSDS
jgi:ribonuclease HI